MQNNKGNALYIKRDAMMKTRYMCDVKRVTHLKTYKSPCHDVILSIKLRYAPPRIERTGPAVPPFLFVILTRQ
jgi:hypothetical protein